MKRTQEYIIDGKSVEFTVEYVITINGSMTEFTKNHLGCVIGERPVPEWEKLWLESQWAENP
jgi:hypothetical protein